MPRAALLVPGFIDLHCHGAGGASVDDGAEAIETRARRAQRARHDPLGALARDGARRPLCDRASRRSPRSPQRDPRVLGAHLEGPFLDAEFRGAHDPPLLRPADAGSRRAAARGGRRHAAADHDRARARRRGRRDRAGSSTPASRVAVGHTGADFETALAAFDAGASILTHAFNGMRGIHHRAPGPVRRGDARRPRDPRDHQRRRARASRGRAARVRRRARPRRAHHRRDGRGRLGRRRVPARLARGRRRGAASRGSREGGSIAGSTLTQDDALRRAVVDSGIPLERGGRRRSRALPLRRSAARATSDGSTPGLRRRRGAARRRRSTSQAVWGAGVRLA